MFRDGAGENGELPPNNWRSNFGGPAWTRVTEADGSPGQWYLHLFDTTQPDFDWTNPEVGDEMESVIRFWLDRGADGFRIDVAHGLVKVPGLPDAPEDADDTTMERTSELPMWDQPGVHDIYRRWRKVTDSYAVDGRGRRPDPLRRGVGVAHRRARAVRPARRAAPVVQLRLPDVAVDRLGPADGDHRVSRGGRGGRCSPDLGAVQP